MTSLSRRDEDSLRARPAPTVAQVSENRGGEPPASPVPADAAPAAATKPAHPSSQFSLSGVLLVIGLFAMLLGPVVWLRVTWFPGFMGVVSLVVLAVISIFNDRRRVVQTGWWLLGALYFSALVALYIHS